MRITPWVAVALAASVAGAAGCTIKLAKRSRWDVERLEELSSELARFKSLSRLDAQEASDLRTAKGLLDTQLRGAEDVTIGYDERGVVTRVVDRVLFDSGKATLRLGAGQVLDRVATVLKELVDQPVGVEGHTDNEPIKVSGWAGNDALSLARAQAVADHLIRRGVAADRLTTIGYGERYPIASNDAPQGRQKNRRVEIVILPQDAASSYREEAERVEAGRTSVK